MRKLRSFNVCTEMLQIFFSVLLSVVSNLLWEQHQRVGDIKTLNKLIRKVGSVAGTALEPLEQVGERERDVYSVIIGQHIIL